MKVLKKIFNGLFIGLDKGIFYLDCALMGGVAVWVIVSVMLRYIFSIVFNWTEELIVFLFIASTYFGCVLGIKEDEHIRISLLKDKLPPKVRIVFNVFIDLVTITVVTSAAYLSINWIEKVGRPLTPGLNIPFASIYMMVPISFALITLYEIREIVLKIDNFKNRINKT
jgi:TRAP-type C4-dicarboxylate transport system permease small subunit